MPVTRSCFVIMPFRPDLNYFYLYLQRYLRDKHGLHCERGDHRILTIPLLEKIQQQILDADVIIGDISGRNANVFYELGLAHSYGKKVIVITQDPITDAPTDIRHLEFIRYDLGQHIDFLNKIDNAIHHVFVDRYSALYLLAKETLTKCNTDMGLTCGSAASEEFQSRIVLAERTQGIPTDPVTLTGFLLPKIIEDTTDINVIQRVTEWLTRR